MLIECNNCGAPLDVKTKERIVKCAYCGVQTQLAEARTVAAATPEGWKPPQQWQAPIGSRSGQQVFTYHKPLALVRGIITSIVLMVVITSFAGYMVSRQVSQAQESATAAIGSAFFGAGSAQDAMQQAKKAIEQATQGALAQGAGIDYFGQGGAQQAVGAFKTALGASSIMAQRLVLYPSYATLAARDPKNPTHYDTYSLHSGVVGAPSPISNSSIGKDIEKHLVDLDKVTALSKLPALIKQTLDTLKYEDAKVSHVIVEHGQPFVKGIVVRVYVSGPRDSGRIDFNADGSVNRVFK